jgi:hypothetical protein
MFEVFAIASCTLAIVLYGQARLAARAIRRNRARDTVHGSLVLQPLPRRRRRR